MANRGSRGAFLIGKLQLANNVQLRTGSGAPTDGTSGTGNGEAGPGSLYFDYTNKRIYQNTGTKASPAWVQVAGDALVRYAEVSITNAEMLALRATPKTLVAAPGAGFVNRFLGGELFFDYTGAYTETADNMAVKYTDGSGVAVSQTIEATGFVDATADTMTTIEPKIDAIVAKTGCDNQALVLHNTGDGEYGGGNAANVVRARIRYSVVPAGW